MRLYKLSIVPLLCLNLKAQVSCSPTLQPTEIFYPNTTSQPTNSPFSIQYLCGPNTIVYDSIPASLSCYTAYVNALCTLNVVSFGCSQHQEYYLKNGARLNLISYVSPIVNVVMEPGAFLHDPFNSAVVSFCNSLVFPQISCSTSSSETNPSMLNIGIWYKPDSKSVLIRTSDDRPFCGKITISDTFGKVLLLRQIETIQEMEIPLNTISPGIYIIRIQTLNGEYVKKIFIQP